MRGRIDPHWYRVRVFSCNPLVNLEQVSVLLANCLQAEPVNRIAVAYALEGKSYISEPYVSDVFNREIVSLSAPCEDTDGSVKGVVTMRYDLQSSMADLVTGLAFGATGSAIVVDGNGRVMVAIAEITTYLRLRLVRSISAPAGAVSNMPDTPPIVITVPIIVFVNRFWGL